MTIEEEQAQLMTMYPEVMIDNHNALSMNQFTESRKNVLM